MKAILLVAALTLVATQAHASWAENANKQYPVYTGTDAALARAQGGRYYGRYHHRHYVRPYVQRRYYERW
jgi:hypothetical protein